MGICFTFTGANYDIWLYPPAHIYLLGLGGLIGTPIAGALLSSKFLWWRPVLFSGLCVVCGSSCFIFSRILLARARGTQKVQTSMIRVPQYLHIFKVCFRDDQYNTSIQCRMLHPTYRSLFYLHCMFKFGRPQTQCQRLVSCREIHILIHRHCFPHALLYANYIIPNISCGKPLDAGFFFAFDLAFNQQQLESPCHPRHKDQITASFITQMYVHELILGSMIPILAVSYYLFFPTQLKTIMWGLTSRFEFRTLLEFDIF